MSHPNPSHDRENEYPADDYKPVRKKYAKSSKKKAMAKKMFKAHGNVMSVLSNLIKSSSKNKSSPFSRKNYGGSADLPPGYRDSDFE